MRRRRRRDRRRRRRAGGGARAPAPADGRRARGARADRRTVYPREDPGCRCRSSSAASSCTGGGAELRAAPLGEHGRDRHGRHVVRLRERRAARTRGSVRDRRARVRARTRSARGRQRRDFLAAPTVGEEVESERAVRAHDGRRVRRRGSGAREHRARSPRSGATTKRARRRGEFRPLGGYAPLLRALHGGLDPARVALLLETPARRVRRDADGVRSRRASRRGRSAAVRARAAIVTSRSACCAGTRCASNRRCPPRSARRSASS